ncbi:MAG: site-specific integrase [Myxococcales bacterium]|nr:site-specific integrase [Myxococcales bacterium]
MFGQPDGSPLASNALERACKATMRAAGLTRVDGSPKALGGHSLRHTWASHCMMQGFPPRVVMAWAGWSSLAMLERYSHLSPEHCADHIDRLAPHRGLRVIESTGTAVASERESRGGNTGGNTIEERRQEGS